MKMCNWHVPWLTRVFSGWQFPMLISTTYNIYHTKCLLMCKLELGGLVPDIKQVIAESKRNKKRMMNGGADRCRSQCTLLWSDVWVEGILVKKSRLTPFQQVQRLKYIKTQQIYISIQQWIHFKYMYCKIQWKILEGNKMSVC